MLEILTQLGTMGWTNVLTIIVLILVLFAEADKLMDGVCKLLNRIGIQITTRHQRRDDAQEQEIQSLKQQLESYQSTTVNRETEWHNQSIDIRNGLLSNQQNLLSNQQKLENTMNKISSAFTALDKRILDEQITRMRWRILDFSDSLANGNSASLEQFNNIIDTHTEYENILRENKMTNGLVSASYEFIFQKYQELLRGNTEEE